MNNKQLYNPDLAILPILVANWEDTPANSIVVYQNNALRGKIGSWEGRNLIELLDVISNGNGKEQLNNLIINESLAISGTINATEIKFHSHKCTDHIQMTISDNTEINKIRDNEKRTDLINSFLNIGSHELLTPLNVILSSTSWLLQDGLSEEHKTSIQYIDDYANSLSDIVSEMLNMIYEEKSDIQQPDSVCQQPLNISESIQKLLPIIKNHIEDKDLLEISLKSNSCICMSEHYFRDIMTEISINLRRNTPKGKPIKISTFDDTDSINIIIENECYGIPTDQLEKIFDPFYRYQDPNKHSSGYKYGQGGIGMGLTIIKKHLTHANGKTWFENKSEYAPDKENKVTMHIQFPK